MKNRKDIGKIFKEKINYLDRNPNNDGWGAIQSELDKKKKKRFILIPFWFKTLGVLTAGILCLWLKGYYSLEKETVFKMNNNSSNTKSNVVNKNTNLTALQNRTESKATNTTTQNADSTDTIFRSNGTTVNKKADNQNSDLKMIMFHTNYIKNSNPTINKRSANKEKNKPTIKNNIYQNKKLKAKFYNIKITKKSSKKTLENTISKNSAITNELTEFEVAGTKLSENKIIVINDRKKNKKVIPKTTEQDTITDPEIKNQCFELFIYGSPTLSGFSKNKSLLDDRLNNNTTPSNVTFSYGSYLCYQATSNLSFRLGLGITNLNLITNNAPVNTQNYSNISYSSGISNSYIYSQSNNSEYMKISQDISYIEIPLEAKYLFINNQIGINSILGINYLYLNKNEISAITTNGNEFKVGKTKDLLNETLGINIGLGLDYNLTKKIKLNIEPMFKYQFKNSQNNDETNLFSLNILTGLQMKFGK